jgi:ligand-binding sensor domain-containing protein/signal transduction histidine kinase
MVLLQKVTKAICLPMAVLILLFAFQQSQEIVGASLPQTTAVPAPTTIAEWLARERPLRFESLSTKQGLSQSTVLCALQDRQGFMWFGTQDGLNRFDGYEFRVYRHVETVPGSLRDNYILSLYEDRAGTLWVGTNKGGLNRYDPQTETFTAFIHNPDDPESLSLNAVNAIVEDHAGYLWVATDGQGVNRFDKKTGKFKRFINDPAIYENRRANLVNALYLDRSGALWLGTSWGLHRFDLTTNQVVQRYSHDPKNPNSLGHNRVQTICEDQNGVLWVGTAGGLHRLANGTLTRFQHEAANADSLVSSDIQVSLLDRRGQLWLGTTQGLDRYDAAAGRFIHQLNDPENPRQLGGHSIHALYEDRAGSLWVGQQTEGLKRYDPQAKPFVNFTHDPRNEHSLSHKSAGAFVEDRAGYLLVTTGNGIEQFDPRTGQFRLLSFPVPNRPPNTKLRAAAFAEDGAGQLWAATNIGLARLERLPKGDLRVHHFSINRGTSVVHATRDGMIWLGTHGGGLWRFDPATEQFTNFLNEPQNPHSLSNNLIYALREDRAGFLWVGTDQGLNRLDRATGQFTRFLNDPNNPASLSYNLIWSLYEDRAGGLWIGTGNGLNQFEAATQQFQRFTEKDGLASANIIGMLEDARGQLWLGTVKGLIRFDPLAKTSRVYDESDGLLGNEIGQRAYYQNRAGLMFFGNPNGFCVFRPEEIRDELTPPPVVLTSCQRYNTEIVEGSALVEPGIAARPAIEFSYKDNILTFEFAALSYWHPEKNQYAYQLAGYSNRWIQLGTKRDVTFTNLDAGDYILHVRGSNADGVWNREGASLRIRIIPPFWRRWWFILLAMTMLAGLVTLAYQYRIRQLRRAQLAQQQFSQQLIESQESERKRIAAELHDSLGQNLIVIKNWATLGLTLTPADAPVREQLDVISTTAVQSLNDVRAIILNLRPHQLETIGLSNTLRFMIEQISAASGIAFTSEIAALDNLFTPEDEVIIYRLVQECVSNIVKHSQAQAATLVMKVADGQLHITVSDNGRGFSMAEGERWNAEAKTLANPQSAIRNPQSGFGLKGLEERVRILRGTHKIISAPGKGTTHQFTIPVLRPDAQ